jgi:hypothetical protein
MSAFRRRALFREVKEGRLNSPAIPLISVIPRIAAWCRQGRVVLAPEGSLDGWPRCNTMQREGNGRPLASQAIGHFYFAE